MDSLEMEALGFARSQPASTGRPGYDPRDLLKLYLYGYLQQVRSSRRLEAECRRNVEVMWLLGRLVPDHKVIAEFRRLHREAVAEAGAGLIRWARAQAMLASGWVAIVLHYFLAENFLIVGIGVVIGSAGAVGLNLWLMDHYELHRMPLVWLPAGAAVLWLLGQLAVLGPALRASHVPPVVATRSI